MGETTMENTTIALAGGLEIRIERADYLTSRTCYFCGADTNEAAVIAAVYADDEDTGEVVCVDGDKPCLSQTPAELASRLEERADHLRAVAKDLVMRAELLRGEGKFFDERASFQVTELTDAMQTFRDMQAAAEYDRQTFRADEAAFVAEYDRTLASLDEIFDEILDEINHNGRLF
jgi:hypothetical protein